MHFKRVGVLTVLIWLGIGVRGWFLWTRQCICGRGSISVDTAVYLWTRQCFCMGQRM
jgi:hypothetical protein